MWDVARHSGRVPMSGIDASTTSAGAVQRLRRGRRQFRRRLRTGHNRCVDSFTEIAPIPIVAVIVIIAAIGAFIAYRSRRRPWAVVLAVIVAVLILYAVIWTVTPA